MINIYLMKQYLIQYELKLDHIVIVGGKTQVPCPRGCLTCVNRSNWCNQSFFYYSKWSGLFLLRLCIHSYICPLDGTTSNCRSISINKISSNLYQITYHHDNLCPMTVMWAPNINCHKDQYRRDWDIRLRC